jgi:S-DNA-T family DNA segregation ATPase FtsK/SpoIIIE
LAQARKKANKTPRVQDQMSRRIQESIFLLSILVGVYLLACLGSYSPLDPGPFNTTASDEVQNTGRVMGAWLSNFLLFLGGYVAYLVPVIVVYAGWSAYSEDPASTGSTGRVSIVEWLARLSGLILFVLASTGLAHMHIHPAAGTMPAGGGGVFGQQVAMPMLQLTGALGSTLFLLALMLVGVTLFTGLSWFHVMDLIGQGTLAIIAWISKSITSLRDWFAGRRAKAKREEVRKADSVRRKTKQKPRIEPQLTASKCLMSQAISRPDTARKHWKPCLDRWN